MILSQSRQKKPTKTRPALVLSPLMPLSRDFAFVVDKDKAAGDIVRAVVAADKALIAGSKLPQHDDCLTHGGMAGQRCLDVARFDADASQFDLLVAAPTDLDRTVCAIEPHVTGAVDEIFRARDERIGNEPPRLLFGGVDIPTCSKRGSQDDLPLFADAADLLPIGEHKSLGIGKGTPDREHPIVRHLPDDRIQLGEGRLRGAVQVHDRGVRAE